MSNAIAYRQWTSTSLKGMLGTRRCLNTKTKSIEIVLRVLAVGKLECGLGKCAVPTECMSKDGRFSQKND